MSLYQNIQLALRGLAANKLRAFLTMLGIIIGVAAVISLVSVGRSVEKFVASEFESLGNNLLFVIPVQLRADSGPQRRNQPLTMNDVTAISDPFLVPDVISVVPEYSNFGVVTYKGDDARTQIVGTTPEFEQIREFYPVIGSYFTQQDIHGNTRVALIGQTVYERLFPDGGSPEGAEIRINNINFRVIGLLEEKGGSGFNDQDNLVLIPISTAQKRLFPARLADGKIRVSQIYVQAINEDRQEAAIAQIELALRESRGVAFRDEDDFTVLSQEEIVGAFGEVTSMLTLFLAVIAGISLLVGGIGIMNIMLVTVTERTREIGLRKAVGAKPDDILRQFLVEAVMIALLGGLIGLLLGTVGAAVIANYSDSLKPTVAWDSVVAAIGVSSLVGLFFGIYPASRAAKLNPIDALRYE